MANNNDRGHYKTHSVGKNAKGDPYAFQLEGYVSSAAPYFKAAADGKAAVLSASIGLPCTSECLLALASGTYERGKEYGGTEFAELKLFGKRAEDFSSVLNKGRRVVVSGRLEKDKYTRKDDTTAEKLVIMVDNIIDAGSFKNNIAPTLGTDIAVSTLSYTSKDSVTRTVPMACTVSGTVIGCRGLSKGGNDTTYLAFGVKTNMSAEKICDLANGTYDKNKAYDEKKTIVNAVVFGANAERLSKVIADGAIVVLSGPVAARPYNGNVTYQIRPRNDAVTVIKYADRNGAAAPEAGTAAAAADPGPNPAGDFAPIEEEDDDLPF